MVRANELSAEMKRELAFTKEELAELEAAKKCQLRLMRIALQPRRNKRLNSRGSIRPAKERMPIWRKMSFAR